MQKNFQEQFLKTVHHKFTANIYIKKGQAYGADSGADILTANSAREKLE